jgi:hypothetical protein
MNKDELLKPRYKVIADWPEMRDRFKNQPIIILDKEDEEGWFTTNGFYQQIFFEKYPHLFKKLEWWEEREESDMPEYVTWNSCNSGIKYVAKILEIKGGLFRWKAGWETFTEGQDYPATKEEYESQNKN